jgi:hypothetical protein
MSYIRSILQHPEWLTRRMRDASEGLDAVNNALAAVAEVTAAPPR